MTNEELVKRFQNGEDVFEELYYNNLGIMDKYAYSNSIYLKCSKHDLINEFAYVLYKCANSYDSTRNVKFITMFTRAIINKCEVLCRDKNNRKWSLIGSLNDNCENCEGNTEIIDNLKNAIEIDDSSFLIEICEKELRKNFKEKNCNIAMDYIFYSLTLNELAIKYGLSKQRASIICIEARKFLKDYLEKNWI